MQDTISPLQTGLNSFEEAYDKGESEFEGGFWDTFSMPDPELQMRKLRQDRQMEQTQRSM